MNGEVEIAQTWHNPPYAVNCQRTKSAILWVWQFRSAGRWCWLCMCYKGKLVFPNLVLKLLLRKKIIFVLVWW